MKIIIADDHALFREGLRRILDQLAPEPVVIEASDHEALAFLADEHPDADLVIVDLSMPGCEPFAALGTLLARHPTLPLVVLSASDRREDMRRTLDMGAMGFIPKREPPSVLLGALQLVLTGGIYVPPALLRETDTPSRGNATLTPRQQDVLAGLLSGKSNKEIGRQLGLSEATVKAHLSAIFRVLQVSNRLEAARVADRLGLGLRQR